MPIYPPPSTNGDRPKLLKVVEVLKDLQIARSTFYQLVREERIRIVKIHGASRVLASDLEDYIQSLPTLLISKTGEAKNG